MQILIFGAPGAGKGTLSEMISKKYKIPHISTGDIFRTEIKSGNSELIQYVEKGLLVPDSVVNKVVEKSLRNDVCKNGFIFDGYPRTTDQAEFLDNAMWKLKKKISIVLNLVANDATIVGRITQRRVCAKCAAPYNLATAKPKKKDTCDKCGSALVQRKDDEPDTITRRINVYKEETLPLIDYYKKKNLLHDIDASKRPKEVLSFAIKELEKLQAASKQAQ